MPPSPSPPPPPPADPIPTRPLTRAEVQKAHARIKPHIHHTPVLTCGALSALASAPQTREALEHTRYAGREPARPRMRLFFKCENLQRVGAFKSRGAFHAVGRLFPGQLEGGVITHSSGNFAQALALAARTRGVPAHIIMPKISTPTKIAATRGYGANVHFSGSTEPERVALMEEIQRKTDATFLPPYDHADILLGQGTAALEFEAQVKAMTQRRDGQPENSQPDALDTGYYRSVAAPVGPDNEDNTADGLGPTSEGLDAVISPVGGGGLLSGTAAALSGTGVLVFGAEPTFQGADDCKRGLEAEGGPQRIPSVSTLTIADGLRTPVGPIPWLVIRDRERVRSVHSVSEAQILAALKLILERMKVVVEPSAAVPLAVALFDEEFRSEVARMQEEGEVWNVGIILSGGNTSVEALGKLFAVETEKTEATEGPRANGVVEKGEREQGKVGMDGQRVAENVAG